MEVSGKGQDELCLPPGNYWFHKVSYEQQEDTPCYSSCPLAALLFSSHPFLPQEQYKPRVISCCPENVSTK